MNKLFTRRQIILQKIKINYVLKTIIIYICTYAKQIVYQINIYTEHESLFNANEMSQYRNSPNYTRER